MAEDVYREEFTELTQLFYDFFRTEAEALFGMASAR